MERLKKIIIIAAGVIAAVLVILVAIFLIPRGPKLSADFKNFVYNKQTKNMEITVTNTCDLRIDEFTLTFDTPTGQSTHGLGGQVVQPGETKVIYAGGQPFDYTAGNYTFRYELRSMEGGKVVASSSGSMTITVTEK